MPMFKAQDRVQVIATASSYLNQYGTVQEVAGPTVRVKLDRPTGVALSLRFFERELISAPHVSEPGKELAHTLDYLRQLEGDATLLFEAADLLPQGSNTKADVYASAQNLRKITSTFRILLERDGMKLGQGEDDVKGAGLDG